MKAQKIVCPVDFSAAGNKALEIASKLARANQAKIYIVHVEDEDAAVQPGVFGGLPPASWFARKKLNSTLPTATEVRFEHDLLLGNPAEKIVEFAQNKDADLIVMGTHGLTGLVRLLLGSVAEGVVRRSPIPVLTLKATCQIDSDPSLDGEELLSEDTESHTPTA